ncbi:unnamed protein product [Amoebophrya sp. A25]|nr:unnamed protein product [Amoebophrya sp. A25]|eukprot:GSA25T00021117001.1
MRRRIFTSIRDDRAIGTGTFARVYIIARSKNLSDVVDAATSTRSKTSCNNTVVPSTAVVPAVLSSSSKRKKLPPERYFTRSSLQPICFC